MTGTKETEQIISLRFTYKSINYDALIRIECHKNYKQYHITIMNGELEKLLFGHHIINEENGVLQEDSATINAEVAELKNCIVAALAAYLQTDPGALLAAN